MKIAIFRTDHVPLNLNQYNCQELGLAKSLQDMGHTVVLVLTRNKNDVHCYPEFIRYNGRNIEIMLLDFFIIPKLDYPLLLGVKDVLKKIKPDICHINEESVPATLQILWYAKKMSIPTVIYHGMYQTPSGFIRNLYEKVHAVVFRPWMRSNIKHIFTKTSFAENYIKLRKYKNTSILPVGLDTSKLLEPVENFKLPCEMKNGCKVVLYVGAIEKRRNVMFMLELAKFSSSANFHFIIIGKGPEETAANKYIIENNLNNVTLLGAIPQDVLAGFYKSADVFVLASNYEIFGMVLLEAMYFGLPVISNINAGSVDLITIENGAIVSELKPELWLEEMINWSSKDKTKINNKIRNIFDSNFAWAKVAVKYNEVVELYLRN